MTSADELLPFSVDPAAALSLGREALIAQAEEGISPEELFPFLEEKVRSGRDVGGLLRRGDRSVGFALWDPPGPLGPTVRLLFLAPSARSASGYADFLSLIERRAGPVLFLPSPIAGLTREEEAGLLRPLGFATYARSDMGFPREAPTPPVTLPPGTTLRSFRPEDAEAVARVHAAAYEGHFDRYLFLEDLDPLADARAAVRDLRTGRWGEFLAFASTVVITGDDVVGETLVVRTRRGALIADVAVAPEASGHGIGRAAVAGTIAALRERETGAMVRLVVTEGNRRAVRLYEGLGFVRTLGPTMEWYRASRIPVGPELD